VRISTVALGTPEGAITDPSTGTAVPVPPDPATLQAIARASNGRSFSTGDTDQLTSIYKSLGTTLATRHEPHEVTAGFAAAGLVLLLGAGIASVRMTGRLP
jgi:Ca-activated chloride channel family protein